MSIICNEKHEYYVDGNRVPGVTEILVSEKIIDTRFMHDEYCALRGTYIHQAISAYLRGTLDGEPEGIVGEYFQGFLNFARDFKINEIVYCEEKLYSPKWRFAGTLDLFGQIGKLMILCDWKSGASLHPSTALQLAMYKILVEGNFRRKVKETIVVKLSPNKYSLGDPKIYNNPHNATVAMGIINSYHWKQQNIRRLPDGTSWY